MSRLVFFHKSHIAAPDTTPTARPSAKSIGKWQARYMREKQISNVIKVMVAVYQRFRIAKADSVAIAATVAAWDETVPNGPCLYDGTWTRPCNDSVNIGRGRAGKLSHRCFNGPECLNMPQNMSASPIAAAKQTTKSNALRQPYLRHTTAKIKMYNGIHIAVPEMIFIAESVIAPPSKLSNKKRSWSKVYIF